MAGLWYTVASLDKCCVFVMIPQGRGKVKRLRRRTDKIAVPQPDAVPRFRDSREEYGWLSYRFTT